MDIEIKVIDINDEYYIKELELRNEILRKPINLNIYDENLDESNDFHIIVIYNNELVGCLVLTIINDSDIKMRQVAVKEILQCNGIGKKLVQYAENFALNKGFKKIILNGRKSVIEFYKNLNYICNSDEFIEVGIPHYKMYKNLNKKNI